VIVACDLDNQVGFLVKVVLYFGGAICHIIMKAAGDFEVVSGNLNFHWFPPSISVDCLVMKMYACF
jgi:hypothetical protein